MILNLDLGQDVKESARPNFRHLNGPWFNPKSTGLFPPGEALGGVFSTTSVRLDPDILES